MSKGNMLQGQARGKVGDLVFSVNKGQQVTRVYNASPANPRSKQQMTQRVKLGAAVGFYKRTKNFFKFAFKKTQKQSDYNAFIKENINIAPYLTKSQVLENIIVPAPYIMTRGDLDIAQGISFLANDDFTVMSASTSFNPEGRTVQSLMKSIGAQVGDMITLYMVQSYADGGIAGKNIARAWGKYTFKANDLEEALDDVNFDEAYNLITDTIGSQGTFGIDASIKIPGATVNTFCCGAVVVLSRRIPGSPLMVSSSTMQLNALAQSTYEAYRTDAQLEVARNSYGASEDAFLVPETPSEH